MKVCIQKCPELDCDNAKHCRINAEEDMEDWYERYSDCCPCGNTPIWEEIKEDE